MNLTSQNLAHDIEPGTSMPSINSIDSIPSPVIAEEKTKRSENVDQNSQLIPTTEHPRRTQPEQNLNEAELNLNEAELNLNLNCSANRDFDPAGLPVPA